ncbi:MAG: hypothetical protein J0L52_04065 [Caulobacterales bacterium]|nr:hypothetical protein [Caulobacterales bacterium]
MRTLLLSGAFLALTAGAALAADRCACCEEMAEGQAMACCENMAEGEPCCCEQMNHSEDQSADHDHDPAGHDAPAEPATGTPPAT